MPQPSKLELPALNLGNETIGSRLKRLRKERGLSQRKLAKKMGLTQTLISAYELDKRGLSAEMVARFALTFGITTDEIIGLKSNGKKQLLPNLRIMKRLREIEKLSAYNQKVLLKMIDSFIRDNKSQNTT